MKETRVLLLVVFCFVISCCVQLPLKAADENVISGVTAPPESLKCDSFYKKYVDCNGLPVVSSEKVADAALIRASDIINKMLCDRSDIRAALVKAKSRFVIIGATERTTEIPEYSDMKPKEFWDKRARGFGDEICSAGEENILCLPIDRYDDESILIHEFAHTIHGVALKAIDPNFEKELSALYKDATGRGLWQKVYAGSNASEYWAEGVQDYYDCNREKNWNHNHVNTREELIVYDANLANFVAKIFNHSAKTDWRYRPLVVRPQVVSPPESLNCDAFYKKYVYCRDLPLLGSGKVSDEAMLEASNIIRNMFRYRHDILLPMIEQGLRCVVIGASEKITDIPEYKKLDAKALNKLTRSMTVAPQQLVISCGEENLLNYPIDPHDGENMLIGEFARAVYTLVGQRPVDEQFDKSRRKQQFELNVKRIDVNFQKKLKELYGEAMAKGLWENTLAAGSCEDYWAEGVQSWFDANRKSEKADGMHNHVSTRQELESYDPNLAGFIAEVFQHTKREDWRYKRFDRYPKITAPPENLKLDPFYKKYVNVGGIVVTASANVADEALVEVHYIVSNMLAHRPDILAAMVKHGARLAVIGDEEETCDIPEYSDLRPRKDYWNRRARGLGGQMTSCGEENLLNYPRDRYEGESILIHEFGHGIADMGLRRIDPNYESNLRTLYNNAKAKGLFNRTYAMENPAEYWAEGVQDWFDCNKESRDGNPDGVHNHVNTRKELKEYDPDMAAFIGGIFRDDTPDAWRWVPYKQRNSR